MRFNFITTIAASCPVPNQLTGIHIVLRIDFRSHINYSEALHSLQHPLYFRIHMVSLYGAVTIICVLWLWEGAYFDYYSKVRSCAGAMMWNNVKMIFTQGRTLLGGKNIMVYKTKQIFYHMDHKLCDSNEIPVKTK